jgi:hypothetical protein
MKSIIILSILRFLLWPIIIIGFIIFFVKRRNKKFHPSQDKEWYLQLALSKEDAVSQVFLLFSFFFLGVTLLAFNRDFSDPLSWRAILFITSFIGLIGAYYLKTIYTLAFSLIGLVIWWGAQAAQWIDGKNIKSSGFLVGLCFLALIFYSLGHLHEKQIKYKRFALVYLILGIITATGILFFFSTKLGISTIGGITKGAPLFDSWELVLSLFIFLVSLIGITSYTAVQKLLSPFELIAVFVLAFLFGVIALLPEQIMFIQVGQSYSFYSGNSELSSIGVFWAFIYNFAIFFELLGLIFSGYLRRESWLINLGALFLFLLIIVKYFDWFFTFLDKSIFFIGAGILLFVVGWFMEKGRRYIISNIKTQTKQI